MRDKIYCFFVFLFLGFLTINCFPEDFSAKDKIAIQELRDIVVSNPKTPELKMRIVFKEELSIGKVEGDENYMFGNTIIFNTDDEGNFYVSDVDSNRILKYNPEGKYLLTFGRKGQGPGEFQSLNFIRFDKENNLYINDSTNSRISFFNKDGKFLRQLGTKDRYASVYINSKGFFVGDKFDISPDGNAMKMGIIYGLFDDKFNLMTELYKDEINLPTPRIGDESSLADSLAEMLSKTAFRPNVIYTVANNDFIYLGYPEKYEINVYSPEGKLVRKITRDYDPITVTEKDKEEYVQRINESFSAPIYTEGVKKKAFQKIKYPKYKPAYQSFTMMENGWLAVLVDYVKDEYTLFDIFNQEGKFIAQFKTPVPAEGMFSVLLFFKNGRAYSVATENDFRFAKRYSYEIQEYRNNEWVRK
jgi:hypothetical protein